jgi:glycosyltransferase involved in cell wall biosynthesis
LETAKILKENYPKIRFLLIGNGTEKDRLIQMAKENDLKNIEFKDPVPKKEIAKIINKSDVLILLVRNSPLYKYGISFNKLYDYLASGKPVIFSSNAVNNPVKEDNAGVTVPPDNPKTLADAIIKLYQMSPEERRKMGMNGKKYVEKYHNISVLVDILINVIGGVYKENDRI